MPSGMLQKLVLVDLNYSVMIWAGRVWVCSPSVLGVAWGRARMRRRIGASSRNWMSQRIRIEVRLNLILQSARACTLVLINKDFCCKSQWEKRKSSELIADSWRWLPFLDGWVRNFQNWTVSARVVCRFNTGFQNSDPINHLPTALSRNPTLQILILRSFFEWFSFQRFFSAFAQCFQPFRDQGGSYRKHPSMGSVRTDCSHSATAPGFQMSVLVTAEYTLNIFTRPCCFEKIPGEGTPSTG